MIFSAMPLPALFARLRDRAPGLALRVIPSNVPTPEMLQDEHCQLIVSPRPPQGADIMQKRLFEDRYRLFYDPARRSAPRTTAEYLAADHITVVYEPRRVLDLDAHLIARRLDRRFVVTVPGFAGVPAFLHGSDLLATAPGLLRFGLLQGLASAPTPFPCPKLPMYMIWSRRDHDDPAHRWIRAELETVARPLGPRARGEFKR
jgi:DNA-binding transcriptional LysR family regulator